MSLLDSFLSFFQQPSNLFNDMTNNITRSRTVGSAGTGGTTGVLSTVWKWMMSRESTVPVLPRSVRYLILFIFILNWRSWPFVWHYRILSLPLIARLKGRFIGVKQYYHDLGLDSTLLPSATATANQGDSTMVNSKTVEKYRPNELGKKRLGRFERPMGVRCVTRNKATLDDCDYNMHLSNSSYAKNLDRARMKACIEFFSPYFVPGGWMALGAAHYQYIKEIPMFSDYEIRVSIGGFEEKWLYLVAEFVTFPKKSTKRHRTASPGTQSLNPIPPISQAPSGTGTPDDASAANSGTTTPDKMDVAGAVKKNRSVRQDVREDGSVLHCFSVSTYCFKMGRLTVPPRVVLAFSGYGQPSNFERTERLLASRDHGRSWIKEGWKQEKDLGTEWDATGCPIGPNGELNAEIAEELRKGREMGGKLKEGLDGLKAVVAPIPKR